METCDNVKNNFLARILEQMNIEWLSAKTASSIEHAAVNSQLLYYIITGSVDCGDAVTVKL